MSVDTRTPRTPAGDRQSGFASGLDDGPALSMVKVPSDPAQVIVTHASFRVQLGASSRRQSPSIARHLSASESTARMPAGSSGGSPARRRAVVWSGHSAPDDTGAHRLLQAVRAGSVGHAEQPSSADAGATQVIPRVEAEDLVERTMETPLVGAQRTRDNRLLPHMQAVDSVYDEPSYAPPPYDGYDSPRERVPGDPARHAYYPGRRLNLGVVLLPLRIFLGFLAAYAGMGKLCDPVYFDGGKRGSMVKWLNTLHPWEVAEPLRQFALHHPVGSGLVIAFLQVVVGVLTILGCWQRVAAVVGAVLSAALIVTVSWKTVPVYDTPDIINLAAWSPLIIAGAPVYSVDGRLASAAWRRLGPRAPLWQLRRYTLRRGALVTSIVVGLTLLFGSLLGAAVRDADRVVVPGPGEAPRNELPGSPLPSASGKGKHGSRPSGEATSSPTTEGTTSTPSTQARQDEPTSTRDTSNSPSQTQGSSSDDTPSKSTTPVQEAPSTTSSGPSSGGSSSSSGSSDGGASSGGNENLVGGLLG
ncbi:DoxX family protein [Streptomyces acidiscabies]|uniref:DoxX family membrane protein n=1 Tax=Streptomyces acidiscabies TaxID=42234 RepID=A0AAP6BLG5_9ACTN|nr:DoxX family protein [Streptomyces acidiscabies]MBP5938706.1 DoxX family membrane protein [Streptomyces sp. LBUM 1476]MBZ3909818.1 DoxX family membrane protein [Streptomyces acidiscabies]MDX2966913.1 DoxX family membrane protein [Streptomyces acidiscabies]MDX3026021.1 DoxX family membrane protein [Streptomyces acidiscabies]MDX3797017.1 DoxX family membrane protein [Streptomyces acidiscabies]